MLARAEAVRGIQAAQEARLHTLSIRRLRAEGTWASRASSLARRSRAASAEATARFDAGASERARAAVADSGPGVPRAASPSSSPCSAARARAARFLSRSRTGDRDDDGWDQAAHARALHERMRRACGYTSACGVHAAIRAVPQLAVLCPTSWMYALGMRTAAGCLSSSATTGSVVEQPCNNHSTRWKHEPTHLGVAPVKWQHRRHQNRLPIMKAPPAYVELAALSPPLVAGRDHHPSSLAC